MRKRYPVGLAGRHGRTAARPFDRRLDARSRRPPRRISSAAASSPTRMPTGPRRRRRRPARRSRRATRRCASVDFLSYEDMVAGVELPPDPVPAVRRVLQSCSGTSATAPTARARRRTRPSARPGCPQPGVPNSRQRSDLYLLRVTDERVPEADKKLFAFPLSIHGIERAGAEAGVRAAEDLATWAACEAGTGGGAGDVRARRARSRTRSSRRRPR